jgi:uncharacterized membrane protein YdjX (TVP38/TMEM64 family)
MTSVAGKPIGLPSLRSLLYPSETIDLQLFVVARARMSRKLVLCIGLAIILAAAYFGLRDRWSLEAIAERVDALRVLERQHPLLVYGAAFLAYLAASAIAIPGTSGKSFFCGWLFGFWPAVALVNLASTAGATLAFLMSRHLLCDWLHARLGPRVHGLCQAAREDPSYLFLLRLTPVVPFFAVNLMMGLTGIRLRTFWWVSQLGMLGGNCLCVFAGSRLPGPQEIFDRGPSSLLSAELIAAFVLLATFPVAAKAVAWRMRPGLKACEAG